MLKEAGMINSIRTMESGKKMIKEEDGMIEIEIAGEIADTASKTQKKEGNERTEIAKTIKKRARINTEEKEVTEKLTSMRKKQAAQEEKAKTDDLVQSTI